MRRAWGIFSTIHLYTILYGCMHNCNAPLQFKSQKRARASIVPAMCLKPMCAHASGQARVGTQHESVSSTICNQLLPGSEEGSYIHIDATALEDESGAYIYMVLINLANPHMHSHCSSHIFLLSYIPCHTIPYHHNTIPYHTIIIPYHTIPCKTLPRTPPHHYTEPYHTSPTHTIQC